MWLFALSGFYSIVHDGCGLVVRSRVRRDLERLRRQYLPTLGRIEATPARDYQWRARVPAVEFAAAMQRISGDLNYPNFKEEVRNVSGPGRAEVYGAIWAVARSLADEEAVSRAGLSDPRSRVRDGDLLRGRARPARAKVIPGSARPMTPPSTRRKMQR